MPIVFECHSCQRRLRVPDGSGGSVCECPSCSVLLEVPEQSAASPQASNSASGYTPDVLYVPCPNCQQMLKSSPDLLGTKGRCHGCGYIFTISTDPQPVDAKDSTNSSSFVFSCPQCQQLFAGAREMEGRRGKCHVCQAVFQIELKENHHSPTDAPTDAPSRPPLPKPPGQSLHAKHPTKQSVSPTRDVVQAPGPLTLRARPPIQFSCFVCHGILEVPGAAAGHLTSCPFCHQALTVPN